MADIKYFDLTDAFARVGGISSVINASILVIVKYLVYKNWEKDVFESINGGLQSLKKVRWDKLVRILSFQNLFKIYDRVENLK